MCRFSLRFSASDRGWGHEQHAERAGHADQVVAQRVRPFGGGRQRGPFNFSAPADGPNLIAKHEF